MAQNGEPQTLENRIVDLEFQQSQENASLQMASISVPMIHGEAEEQDDVIDQLARTRVLALAPQFREGEPRPDTAADYNFQGEAADDDEENEHDLDDDHQPVFGENAQKILATMNIPDAINARNAVAVPQTCTFDSHV